MKRTILFLLLSQFTYSQTDTIQKLIKDGNEAFLRNDFALAKSIYTKITELDPKRSDGWYNLAASELKLDENEKACEHFYKVYLLSDSKVVDDIKKYCPNFRNGKIMSVKDVQEVPKFIYKEKEYNLFENDVLNPVYLKIIKKEITGSSIIMGKMKRKSQMFVRVSVNSFDVFNGTIANVHVVEEKDEEIVRLEVLNIFKSAVKYKAAKNNGVSVDIWEKAVLPIQF